MSAQLDRLLAHWRAEPTIGANINYWKRDDARPARFAEVPEDMHPRLRDAFHGLGYQELYEHQAEAWKASQAGKNVVVVTGNSQRKDALLQPACFGCCTQGFRCSGFVSLPDQGIGS